MAVDACLALWHKFWNLYGLVLFGSQSGTAAQLKQYLSTCSKMPAWSKPIKHVMPESDEQVQREVEEFGKLQLLSWLWPLLIAVVTVLIVSWTNQAFSVSHGYGFPRGFQLLVYTGMGTVYQMSEPCDTVPIWEVWQCLAVSGIGRTASRLLPFGYIQLVNVYPSPYLPALSVLFRLLDSFLSASMLWIISF